MSLAIKAARAGQRTHLAGQMGDPGLLGGIWGGIKGLATGGVIGAVSGAVSGFRGSPKPAPVSMPTRPPAPTSGPGLTTAIPTLPLPGGARLTGPNIISAPAKAGTGTMANGTKLACPAGFHPNKASYFLKSGTFVPEGTRCVRNRRRDPLNPRALRRAIGRIDAGKTWQSKLREIETGKHTKAGTKK